MKKISKSKLSVGREMIRELSSRDIGLAAGGYDAERAAVSRTASCTCHSVCCPSPP